MIHVLQSAVLKLAILEQIHNKVMEVRLSLFLMVNILTLSIVLSFLPTCFQISICFYRQT